MPKEKTDIEIIRGIIEKTDDLYWLIKSMQNSGFQEMASDHIYASFNCLLRLIRDISNDAVKLDKPVL